ncbi:MAG: Na/Pi symporter, partial [Chthoniobacteraceae bacterium]
MIFGILTILGSLGLFLYGMKVMSEGLQRSAGERLRKILDSMTRNRFSGLMTGFLTTSVIQSSSATTVMLVGFVNAGLITLRQAIGVIMGANIGTTVTFWIVSFLGFKFSITGLALPSVGIGMVLLMFRRLKASDAGAALIGFGLLFLGLDFLKDSVPDLRQHTEALAFMKEWETGSFLRLLAFFAFGTLLTVVVQSSSAAGAITLALAYKGWIDFPSSCAIVLGENVGTTITAN